MSYAPKLDGNKKISLKDYPTKEDGGLKKEKAEPLLEKLSAELGELQELCYAAAHNAVLIVLQGMDTSGKDGTIRSVMSSVNPQGCQVVSFKAPTAQELAHDFLWRVHLAAPSKGMITIFNRSHYEDVLVVRVHDLVPEKTWQKRYEHINNFEKQLADDNGTIILKFFLHISQEEQLERLAAREDEINKRWKLAVGDYKERLYWDEYTSAYDAILEKCSTHYAPWYVVPADRKWFRNLAIAEAIVEALRPYRADWERELRQRGEIAYQQVLAMRKNSDDNGK
jgi:PPK2 family polyphosphate:nucleotide phosphotransferase